jgi:hypothetical protein
MSLASMEMDGGWVVLRFIPAGLKSDANSENPLKRVKTTFRNPFERVLAMNLEIYFMVDPHDRPIDPVILPIQPTPSDGRSGGGISRSPIQPTPD